MAVRTRIPVEFYFDEELGTWHFHVDEPRVVGGGQGTLEEAQSAAATAIAFALEGAPRSGAHEGAVQLRYLDATIG